MTREVKLLVNEEAIELDFFVESFIDHTISGMLESLEGVGTIENIEISIDGVNVLVKVNSTDIPINPFVNTIMLNTIFGMVSSLRGVGSISDLKITIQR